MMYNDELKNEYLKTIFDKGTKNTVKNVLQNISKTEEDYNQDIFSFNQTQIYETLYNFDAGNPNILLKNWSVIEKYINWALSVTDSTRSWNLSLPTFAVTDFYKFIRISKAKGMYIKDDYHLREILNRLANNQDKLLILLGYYAINGKRQEELLSLKKEQCKNGKVLVERHGSPYMIEIPEDLYAIIEDSKNETQYLNWNGKAISKSKVRTLIDSDYIIRCAGIDKLSQGEKISYAGYCIKMKKLAEWTEMPYITTSSIIHSGMYNAIKLISKEREVTIHDYKRVFEQFDIDFNNYSQMKVNYFSFFDWLWTQE